MSSKITLLLIFSLILAGCSSGEKKKTSDTSSEKSSKATMDTDGDDDELFDDEKGEDSDVDLFKSSKVEKKASPEIKPVEITGDAGEYTVEKGDTYMIIAFKIYGDYSKWKLLRGYNPKIKENGLSAGVTLKYQVPKEAFNWAPQGNPHLIAMGETLGSISNDKYGTIKKWKDIFENNKPMIKDANLIFAGFTLYYVPEERSIASEKKK